MHITRISGVLRPMVAGITLMLVSIASADAEPLITEFMAANTTTLTDEDGAYSDWIEIHNPAGEPVNLDGWYLTDSAASKTKWQLPPVTVAAGQYVVIFASGKNRRDSNRNLHTNFALSAGGEYLGLIKPDGATVTSEFNPVFPPQTNDISYGTGARAGGMPPAVGYFRTPTPGAANSDFLLLEKVTLSRPPGPFSGSFTLTLMGAQPGQHIRYVLTEPSAAGASVPEPTATDTLYSGPFSIATTTIVRAAVFSGDDMVRGLSSAGHYLKLNPLVASFSSQLPMLIIDTHGLGHLEKDGVDHPAWLYSFQPDRIGASRFTEPPELATPITTTVRGSSSASFPKQSYNLKLNDNLGNKFAQPLLGQPAFEKWALIGPWLYDRTFIYNCYIFELSRRIGRWAPRTRLTEIFFNAHGGDLGPEDYAGVYALTDRVEVDGNRVAITALSAADSSAPALTGGYLLKIDPPDADEFGWITARGFPASDSSVVVVASPKADELSAPQRDYIRSYVQKMEDALYADFATAFRTRTYTDYIDRASWVDHHLLNTLAANPDALERSAYFTKDRGGKLIAGPIWDFDRTFGGYDERCAQPDIWFGLGGTDVWNFGWWGVLARDPEFMQDWIDRWQTLRKAEFSTSNLIALAKSLAASIGPEAAARDVARWPDNISAYGGTHAGEIEHLLAWLTARTQWIDRQFVAPPAAVTDDSTLTLTPPEGAELAYTLDGSDPRALGGALGATTLRSPGALTLPATTNVHARSYRPDADSFPGSPWSSAVGGAGSTPLLPRAELINLSSRAVIGSGEASLIVGSIVADTAAKEFVIRGVSPGLAVFGVQETLPDPVLQIVADNGTELYRNAGWQSGPDPAQLSRLSTAVGAFSLPAGSLDSALVAPLPAGAHTIVVSSATGRSGIGLAELYALGPNGRCVNLSTRARVQTGAGILISGFTIQGAGRKRLLIRAVGPTLEALGITDVLADPVLTLYAGQTIMHTNDDWSAGFGAARIAAATAAVNAFAIPPGSRDAAMVVTLPAGSYTVGVSGKGNASGVALLEIHDLP